MTAPFGEQPARVETSPGGVGFIRTDTTKPNVPKRPEGVAPVAWLGDTFPPEFDFDRDTWNGLRWTAEGDPVTFLPEQEWDWPRACPWCAVTVPVGVPTVLVDGEHVCQECAL